MSDANLIQGKHRSDSRLEFAAIKTTRQLVQASCCDLYEEEDGSTEAGASASSETTETRKVEASTGELVDLIEEQAGQLSHLTTRLLKTAQLAASDLVPNATEVALAPLIDDVVTSLRQQLTNFSFTVRLSRNDLSLFCDRHLVIALLTQYLENATKYGDPGTAITLQVVEKLSAVVFSVRSFGRVIPSAEHERIFDRFYRSPIHAQTVPSTGVGLSIVKCAAQAHGGHVWVTSDAQQGTIFYASLPKAEGDSAQWFASGATERTSTRADFELPMGIRIMEPRSVAEALI